MTLALNISVFNKIVLTSSLFGFGKGYYMILPFISVLPGRELSLEDVQKIVWNDSFHGGLTSTFLGVPYVDFRIAGVLFISLLLAMISMYFYNIAARKPTFYNISVYAYWTHIMLICLYTYPFGRLYTFIYFFVFSYFSSVVRTEYTNID